MGFSEQAKVSCFRWHLRKHRYKPVLYHCPQSPSPSSFRRNLARYGINLCDVAQAFRLVFAAYRRCSKNRCMRMPHHQLMSCHWTGTRKRSKRALFTLGCASVHCHWSCVAKSYPRQDFLGSKSKSLNMLVGIMLRALGSSSRRASEFVGTSLLSLTMHLFLRWV